MDDESREQRSAAIAAFNELEPMTYLQREEEGDEPEPLPRYAVRLDARVDVNGERFYRLFVTVSADAPPSKAISYLEFVLEVAERHGLRVSLENDGLELT